MDDKDRLEETLNFDTFPVDRLRKSASSGRLSKAGSPLKSYILVQGTVFDPGSKFTRSWPPPHPWLPNWHHVREAVCPSAATHSQPIALNRVQNAGWNNSFAVGTKLAVTRFCISVFCQKSNTTNE